MKSPWRIQACLQRVVYSVVTSHRVLCTMHIVGNRIYFFVVKSTLLYSDSSGGPAII